MATSLSDWSQTPASNDLSNYFQTGMAPSKVKNAGWDVMADMCQQLGPGSLVTSGGSANAQTITNTRPLGALYTGRIIEFNPGFTNTGAMTLQEDGLTAKNVTYAGSTALIAGMVVSGIVARCRYDGTQYQLINPQSPSSSYTGTLTGCTTSPTGTVNLRVLPDGNTIYVGIASNLTATSNTNVCTITGGPSYLTSSSSTPTTCIIFNNGSVSIGQVQIASAGILALGVPNNGGGFSNTGTKGIASSMFSINRTV